MNRGIKLSAFLLLLAPLFVGTVFCKEPVAVGQEPVVKAVVAPVKTVPSVSGEVASTFEGALLDAINETDFIKDRKITIKMPSTTLKYAREDATIIIDMRFKGFGGIYKPLKTAKSVTINFALKDISNKKEQELITNFIKNLETDIFSLFILKTIVLNDSLGSESGVVLRIGDKPVKYSKKDFDNLMAYLFARLAQSAVGKSTFFEKHTSLKTVGNNLSPEFLALMSEELELKLSKIYESYKKFSSVKPNPFIAEKSKDVGLVILKVLMAFVEVENKFKEEAVTDPAAKNLRSITDKYNHAKTTLRDAYEKDSKAAKKLELLANKVRKLKKDKTIAIIKYNQLFAEKFSYLDNKTIVNFLIPAVAKLKSEIKDRVKVNQMYSLLAPLYAIGINVKIFYGMVKGAASTFVGAVGFFARIKQAPGDLIRLMQEKVRDVKEGVTGEVGAMREEALGEVMDVKKGVMDELKDVTDEVTGAVTEAKSGVSSELESVKSDAKAAGKEVKGVGEEFKQEAKAVKSDLSSELGDAQKEIEFEVEDKQ